MKKYLKVDVMSSYQEGRALINLDKSDRAVRDLVSLVEYFENQKNKTLRLKHDQIDAQRRYIENKAVLQRNINKLISDFEGFSKKKDATNIYIK